MIPVAFAAALDALDHRLDARRRTPVAVALSGGSDSLALLRIASAWTQAAGRPLWAFTVDHGLHPDSAAWTRLAGQAAARLGAEWRALAWTGPKPATGLPAAARDARHALLAEATRQAGGCVLLMGHTADDVAESELIRTDTPTHGRLADWSPSPAWPQGRGVFLLRPLLSLDRASLRAWLSAHGCEWLEDPANADLRFARSRARAALRRGPLRPGGPVLPDRSASWTTIARGSAAGAMLDPAGVLEVAASCRTEVLARALVCVSGGSRPPSRDALDRLADRLAAGQAFAATLRGVRIGAEGGQVRLTRELGRAPPEPSALTPGHAQVFDGRFEMVSDAAGWRVAPLAGRAAALGWADRQALGALPAEARPSLPVLLGPGGEVRLPQPFGAGPATAHCLVGARFASALGEVDGEAALDALQPVQRRGAERALILS